MVRSCLLDGLCILEFQSITTIEYCYFVTNLGSESPENLASCAVGNNMQIYSENMLQQNSCLRIYILHHEVGVAAPIIIPLYNHRVWFHTVTHVSQFLDVCESRSF
jgi:hypothetical protein